MQSSAAFWIKCCRSVKRLLFSQESSYELRGTRSQDISVAISSIDLLYTLRTSWLLLGLGVDSNGPGVQRGLAIGEHEIGGCRNGGVSNWAACTLIVALAASLAVLKEKRTNLRIQGKSGRTWFFQKLKQRRNFTPLSTNAGKIKGGTGGKRVDSRIKMERWEEQFNGAHCCGGYKYKTWRHILTETLSKKGKQRNLFQQTSPAKVRTWLLTVQSYSSWPFGILRRLLFSECFLRQEVQIAI